MNLGRSYISGARSLLGLFHGEDWQRMPDAIHSGWRYTISTGKPAAPEANDVVDEDIPAIAAGTVLTLKAARDWNRKDRVGDALRRIADEFAIATTTDEYNEALDGLYDFGDAYRVIIK